MKVFVIIALCIVAAMALPVDETKQEEAPLTLVELDQPSEDSFEDASRVKRHYGG